MRTFLFFGLLLAGLAAQAQTKPIAYKSHAGDMDFFTPDAEPESDFGEIAPTYRVDSMRKINDSVVVEYRTHEFQLGFGDETPTSIDTISNPFFFQPSQISTEQWIAIYYPNTKLIGFDNTNTPKTEIKTEEKDSLSKSNNPESVLEKKGKKKSKKQKEQVRADAGGSILMASGHQDNNGNFPLLVSLSAIYLVGCCVLLWKRQRERLQNSL